MSSRRAIGAKNPAHRVVVGWDNPLMTFFAQVDRTNRPGARFTRTLLWLGSTAQEYQRPETMAAALAPYAELTPAILAALAGDRAADLDRGPTPLQRAALALTSDPLRH